MFADPQVCSSNGPRGLVVLGSTGSIGTSTLDVVAALPDRFRIVGLVANSRGEELAAQCQRFRPEIAILADDDAFSTVERSRFPRETRLLSGDEAIQKLVSRSDVDIVLAAIVGAAGLRGSWQALEAGKIVALANKESMVVAGPLMNALAARTGGTILPVDSEHSAVHQAIRGCPAREVSRIVLTGSGGPFRGKSTTELLAATPEAALKHPTWSMGPRISIDSATLMNKALEVIEARWLFDLPPEKIDVVVHPESIVHSFVEYVDGSVLAQLSPPDMRLPIQYALTYPERLPGPAHRINWAKLGTLRFEVPDRSTFPALDLGFEAARRGGTCGAVLNAADEVAVAGFLAGSLPFLEIARCCREILNHHDYEPAPDLDGLLAADRRARQEAERWIRNRPWKG